LRAGDRAVDEDLLDAAAVGGEAGPGARGSARARRRWRDDEAVLDGGEADGAAVVVAAQALGLLGDEGLGEGEQRRAAGLAGGGAGEGAELAGDLLGRVPRLIVLPSDFDILRSEPPAMVLTPGSAGCSRWSAAGPRTRGRRPR
jgi:hypothetical protein